MWSCSWTVTSRSDSGGLLLLSRCFPRALTDPISLCCGIGGCFPVNTEAYGSYPDSQHHRASTSPTLVLSVPGGDDPLRPRIAMSLQQHFVLSPRLWLSSRVALDKLCCWGIGCWDLAVLYSWSMDAYLAVLQAKGITEGIATKTKGAPWLRTSWYLLMLQVWGREHMCRLWPQAVSILGWGWWPLMDEWNKLLRGIAPPKGAVRTQLPFPASAPCTCRVCCGSVMSHSWGGGWHMWHVSSRLSSTLNSSLSLLQCCCKQRFQKTCGAFRTSQLLTETK